jgi:hypothetical protein
MTIWIPVPVQQVAVVSGIRSTPANSRDRGVQERTRMSIFATIRHVGLFGLDLGPVYPGVSRGTTTAARRLRPETTMAPGPAQFKAIRAAAESGGRER